MSEDTTTNAKNMDKCCVLRVPFATLIAFILLIIGLGLFIGPLIAVGERVTADPMLDYVGYYEILKLIIIGVSSGMLTIGVFFLISSVLLTGKRRKRIFWGTSRHICARILNSIAFLFCYLLLISWFIVACALLYPTAIVSFYRFSECNSKSHCIDPKFLRVNPTASARPSNSTDTISDNVCNESKQKFCAQITQQYLLPFFLSFCGAFIIMLSFVHFLISISSNHAYIRADKPLAHNKNIHNSSDDDIDGLIVEPGQAPIAEHTKM